MPKSLKKIDSEILGFDGNKENIKDNDKGNTFRILAVIC
ncbi:hypothetical protein BbiDN127_I0004 (plasmid) [Borreliella bissettiae DN127]|uniref:Uncharacterized protein n=1 Tax=Borrelia bissettiae (strain DSM 17990 / CIP 109136 / DN127) TaxID=521010 RepID=G0AP63_BORBD|nr:hypothetical protein BbiDN127_I0004 [Borreliella bissettiae DN127]